MLVTGGTRFGDETQPVHPCLMVTPPELGSPYPVMETSFLPDLFFFWLHVQVPGTGLRATAVTVQVLNTRPSENSETSFQILKPP